MMLTFGQLLLSAQDFVIDDTTTSVTALTTTPAFLKREINNTVKDIFSLFRKYNLQPLPKTASTVANQIWYHNPPGLAKIESVTMTFGSLVLPLKVIGSQEEWDQLHIVTITSGYPTHIFPRRDDYGIFPTPSGVSTLTLVGNYGPLSMSQTDYVTGTVTFTNNSTTITGVGTTFTATMVGRYITPTDASGIPSGNFYRISAFTSTTVMTIETQYAESTASASTYVVAESPNVPEELHEFIPYRAAGIYLATRRKDADQAQRMLNYYYTGDFSNTSRRGDIKGGVLNYLLDLKIRGRGNSQLVEMGVKPTSPILLGGIWTTTIH